MEITQEAREKLREFLEDYGDGGFVRVSRLVSGGGCCAKLTLGVSLDDERNEEEDLLFTVDGLPVVIDKSLYAAIPEVEIAFDEDSGIVVSDKSTANAVS
jgi:Fe-S cluster assembly iron-binding protein IscA